MSYTVYIEICTEYLFLFGLNLVRNSRLRSLRERFGTHHVSGESPMKCQLLAFSPKC